MADKFDEALARWTQTVEANAAMLAADPVDDHLARWVDHALPCRQLAVAVSRADIRRLQRQITLVNKETPEDPLDPDDNIDLGIVLMGCALRGLDVSDAEAGMWSEFDGHVHVLPRPHREPWQHRLRFAWRAAVTTWKGDMSMAPRPASDIVDAVFGREITVYVTTAHERRLRANIRRFNTEIPDDPMDENSDEDLANVLAATSTRGLKAGEDDERVWSDPAGREWPLPRTKRCSLWLRVRFTLRQAVTTWKAS